MTARKPKARKPAPRKRSAPTLTERVEMIERWIESANKNAADAYTAIAKEHAAIYARINALETRAQFRDASHDEPVSNAGEAVGQHFTLIDELPRASWWRRLLTFMRLP
jgi:hypothetical protein